MVNYDILVRTQSTPNPLAIKFVVNCPIKSEGKATFSTPAETQGLMLADELFLVQGVEQLHMFENVVTVTHSPDIEHQKLIEDVSSVLQTRLVVHNPSFVLESEKRQKTKKENLSPEVQQIEEILDRTIRPGLQADGGDVEILNFADNTVTISYEGACGSCPSSLYGTLDAILSILRHEFHPEVDIMIG